MKTRDFLKLSGVVGLFVTLCKPKCSAAVTAIWASGSMYRYLSADGTSLTSQTVLQSDATLTLPVDASRTYNIEAYLPFNEAGVVAGYNFGISVPASPTNVILSGEVSNDVTGALANSATVQAGGSVVKGGLASTGNSHCRINGLLVNGSNSGSVTVQVAQNTGDASATKLLIGCWLRVTPLT